MASYIGTLGAVVICLLGTVVDVIISGVLLIHGNEFHRFGEHFQIESFQVCRSVFDLWLLTLLRSCFLLGASLGLFFAKRKWDALLRLLALKNPCLYFCIGVVVFVVVKVLLSTECASDKISKIWLWCFMGWTVLSTIASNGLLYLLSHTNSTTASGETGSIQERERLLSIHNSDESLSDMSNGPTTVKKESTSAWTLLSYCKPDIPYISLASLFLLLAATGEIFIPFYTGQIIDGIAIERNKAKFLNAIMVMSAISLGTAISAGLRGGLFTLIAARFAFRINNYLFSSIVRQEIGFFDCRKTGEIVSRLTSDTTKMSDQVGLNINVFLRNCVQSIGTCVFMFKLSWKLSVVTLVGLPLVAFISDIYGSYYKKLATEVQDATAQGNEIAAEVVSSMKTVRSFANEDGECKRYKNKQCSILKLKIKESILYGGYRWCTEILALSLEVVVLLYGGHLVLKGELTGGYLVSFILYQLQLSSYIEEVGEIYTGLMEAVGASEKVFELINREPKMKNNGVISPPRIWGEVSFQNVSFAYPSRPDVTVLKDVSFNVKPGEVVALVGPSGGGKSTCISLLEHFYEPTTGDVLIDSTPVRQLNHKNLHSNIALVGQEPVLFARSVKENIAYGLSTDDEADLNLVTTVAKLANAHNFIIEMPEGYDSQTGEKGIQLSGGQKQRVAIARALVRNPRILLLDEATSALDAESEHLVQDAIYNNLNGHTVLIVAHRLSTIEKADKIVVIDQGRVIAQGKHSELIGQNGMYAKLVNRQMLGHGTGNSLQTDTSLSNGCRKRSNSDNSESSVSSCGIPSFSKM